VFDIFTDLAKRVVTLAQDEAMTLGHDFMGTEHLLLGLVDVREGGGGAVLCEAGLTPEGTRSEVVALLTAAGVTGTGGRAVTDALATIGIDVAEIQRRADDAFGPGQFRFPRPAYSQSAKQMMTLSVQESQALGHDHIGTEHLLLGLLAGADGADEGEGIKVLRVLGADLPALRSAVLTRLLAS
jgi:ATP-dependent Clp protease ATP-binding subunit ClpA